LTAKIASSGQARTPFLDRVDPLLQSGRHGRCRKLHSRHTAGLKHALVFSTEPPELLLDQVLQALRHLQGHLFDASLYFPPPISLNQTLLLD
jgi:hypothetical protein